MQTSLLQEQRNEEQEILNDLCGSSEAVEIWRDTFRLNLNAGRRYDINLTVKDLNLWKWLVEHWGYRQRSGKWKPFNPLKIDHQLAEYQRLAESAEAREIAGYEK